MCQWSCYPVILTFHRAASRMGLGVGLWLWPSAPSSEEHTDLVVLGLIDTVTLGQALNNAENCCALFIIALSSLLILEDLADLED